MTVLEIIRQIIAEKKQNGKVPCHAMRLEILKRFSYLGGSMDEMDNQLKELCEWDEISCHRTINDTAFQEIDTVEIEELETVTVEDIKTPPNGKAENNDR